MAMANAFLRRFLDRAIDGATLVGGIAVVLMMVHITGDIVLRFFDSPPPGTMSIVSYYYMLVVAFIPLAFAERRNAHISVDMFYDLMPRSAQALSSILVLLLCLAVFGLMGIKSWEIALEKFAIRAKFIQGGSVVMTWPGYFLLPIGIGLIWLTYLLKLLRVFVDTPAQSRPAEIGTDG